MNTSFILAVDCGTSSARTIIFDDVTGKQLSVAQIPWQRTEDDHGATRFDTEGNWKIICSCIRKNLEDFDARNVIAVTTTSFRHGLVCIDRDGSVVFACHNADPRSDEQVKRLNETGLAETVFRITGDSPTINALPILMWLRENHPESFSKIWKALSVAGWASYKLSGKTAVEPSMASATCLFDVKKLEWSDEVLKIAGFGPEILPDLVPSDSRIGSVTKEVAFETGLLEGTPVFVPLGDTQAAMIATGDIAPGRSSLIGGTFWLEAQTTGEPITDEALFLRTQCHCVKDVWFNEGCSFYVGPFISWFVKTFGCEDSQNEGVYAKDFDELTRKAALVPPGAYGLQAIWSNLTNVSNWRHCAPAFLDWDILEPSRSSKEVFFRAILEMAAMLAFGDFERIRNITGLWPGSMSFSGGAASNELLAQILSDVMKSKITIFDSRECSALGGVMIASAASGIFDSLESSVKSMSSVKTEYLPSIEANEVYMAKYRRWRSIYDSLLRLSDDGTTKHLWIAAGARKHT